MSNIDYTQHLTSRAARMATRNRMAQGYEDPTDTLAYRVEQIVHYSPELYNDPAGLLALAQSDIPTHELGRASVEAMTRVDYQKLAVDRRNRTVAEQRALFAMDSPERQQALRDAGYNPPDEQPGKGWFRLGVGVPTFVPMVGGKHFTLSAEHDNPFAQVAGGALTAAAMPFKAIDRGTRMAGHYVMEGFRAGQEAVTGVPRAFDRSSWAGNYGAAIAFDRELRFRVERQIGAVSDATWRASVETLINLPDGGDDAETHFVNMARTFDPDAAHQIAGSPEASAYLNHFKQQGGSSDARVRLVATEVAELMREEGIKDTLNFWDAYRDVFNGEAYIPAQRRIEVLDGMLDGDFDALRLAEDLMVGKSWDEIAGAIADPDLDPEGFLLAQYQIQELMGGEDPDKRARFQQAMETLGNGRYSVGREAARGLGFAEGTKPYNIISGSIDALTILVADPTLGLGKAYRGARGAAWVTKNLDRIADVPIRAKAALGLVHEGSEQWGKALALAATSDENFRALRAAGETGLSFREAVNIYGDRITWLRREDYNAMVKDFGRNAVTDRVRSFQDRGAISQWLAAERIATWMRRTKNMDGGIEALEKLSQLDNASLRRMLRDGELDAIWNLTAGGDLLQDLPHIVGGLGDIIQWDHKLVTLRGYGIRDADDIFGFYQSAAGMSAISNRLIAGSSTWLRGKAFELPRITRTGRKRIQAKQWFNDVIDWTHDASITLDGQTHLGKGAADLTRAVQESHRTLRVADWMIGSYMNPDTLNGWRKFNVAGRGAAKFVRMAGDFTHSITTMLPVSTQLHLANEGFGKGVVAFERFAELGRLGELSSAYRRLALDEFISGRPAQLGNSMMLPASAATRGILFRGMIGDLADKLGIADSPMMRKFLEGTDVRVYAPNNLDLVDMHGTKIPAAIVPGVQMSDALAIPDFTMLMAQARRQGFLSKAFGFINHPMVDAFFTSYWKPAMLLRIGFIPRNAGEELLTYAARHGIGDYLVHVGANYAANTTMPVKRMLANGDEVWDIVPRQMLGGRAANRALEYLNRQTTVAERLALGPVIDMLEVAGQRSRTIRNLSERLKRGMTGQRKGALPDVAEKHHRVWIVQQGERTPNIYVDSLAEANHELWGRYTKLSYTDVPEAWLPQLETMEANILGMATQIDRNLLFTGPLETPLIISKYLAEKAAALPRELVGMVLPDSLVESARVMRTAQQLHRGLEKDAMELAYLSAVKDAMGQVLGVSGGRWYGGVRGNDALHVSKRDGDIVLRMSREFREVGAEDPMFHAKVAGALNALLDQDSWAVRAGVEAVQGFVSPSQVRQLETAAVNLQGLEAYVRMNPNAMPQKVFDEIHAKAMGFAEKETARHTERLTRVVEQQDALLSERHKLNNLIRRTNKAAKEEPGSVKATQNVEARARRTEIARELADTRKELGALDRTATGQIDQIYQKRYQQLLDEAKTEWAVAEHSGLDVLNAFRRMLGNKDRNPTYRTKRLTRHALDDGIDATATWIPEDLLEKGIGSFKPGEAVTWRDLMLSSPSADIRALAEYWDHIPPDFRALLVEGTLILSAPKQRIVQMLREGIRREMDNPAHAYEISRAQRMTVTTDGRPAAMLQPEYTERVYLPMLDSETSEQLLMLNEFNQPALVEAINQSGADATVIQYLTEEVLPFLKTETADFARQTADQIGRGGMFPTIPIGIRGSYSPDLAREASETLTEAVIAISGQQIGTPRIGTYGVVERIPGFSYGHHTLDRAGRYHGTEVAHLSVADTAGRITPIDSSTPIVRYSRTPGPDGLYYLDEAGEIVVEGVGPDVLLNDWADQLTKVVSHHLIDNDGGFLHQVTVPGMRRRLSQQDVVNLGEALPERVIHQHLVVPDELLENPWTRMVNYGFDEVIGPAIRSIIRNPMYLRSYHHAREVAPHIWNKAIDENLTDTVRKLAASMDAHPADLIPRRIEWREALESARQRGARIEGTEAELNFLRTSFGVDLKAGELRELDRFVNNMESFHTLLINQTAGRAVIDMVPYIDDHRFKSQMAGWIRNLAPFWFSEETFIKRWARTLKHSPEAFRRAQLYVGAMESTGVIQRDQYGQQVIVFPGGEIVQDVLRGVAKHVFGKDMSIPMTVPLTGQVQYSLPGLDRQGIPSFSPLVAVPFGQLVNIFPELMSVDTTEALFGTRSLHTGLLDQVFPRWASRVIAATGVGGFSEERIASLTMQAIQQMEAEGQRALHEAQQAENEGNFEAAEAHRERAAQLMFPATNDPNLVENYLDTVRNWARNLEVASAVLGFISPTTLVPEFPTEITQQFIQLTRAGMPYEEALGYMLAQDPGATPFTRFATKSTTGAVIPSHMEAGQWVDENIEWLNSWKHAASWAIPQPTASSEFDSMVYYQQLRMGLRERKSPAEFLEDLKFAEAAPVYFESQRNFEEAQLRLRMARDNQGVDVRDDMDRLEVAWQAWREGYMNQHPLFAQRLMSNEGKQNRERTINQMRMMLADPEAPAIAHRTGLEDMIESYDELNRLLGTVAGRSDPDAQEFRHRVRGAFMDWAEDYIVRFPSVMNFYRAVIEPEAGLRNTILMREIT